MFKIKHDKLEFAVFSLTIFTGTLLAWSQVVAPNPDLSSIDRIAIGISGLVWAIAGGLGVYAVSRNQESAAAKQ